MCSGFTLTKSSLIGLNVVYMLVSLITIGVAVHSKYFIHITPNNSYEDQGITSINKPEAKAQSKAPKSPQKGKEEFGLWDSH